MKPSNTKRLKMLSVEFFAARTSPNINNTCFLAWFDQDKLLTRKPPGRCWLALSTFRHKCLSIQTEAFELSSTFFWDRAETRWFIDRVIYVQTKGDEPELAFSKHLNRRWSVGYGSVPEIRCRAVCLPGPISSKRPWSMPSPNRLLRQVSKSCVTCSLQVRTGDGFKLRKTLAKSCFLL